MQLILFIIFHLTGQHYDSCFVLQSYKQSPPNFNLICKNQSNFTDQRPTLREVEKKEHTALCLPSEMYYKGYLKWATKYPNNKK